MRTHTVRSWIRPVAAAVLAVAAITGTSACSSSAPTAASTTSPTGQHLAASDFSTAMKAPGTVVLDVRTPAEYASGHLPKAQNIDVQGSEFATRMAALDKKATYAVYCRSGKRSAAALNQMTAIGFTHAYDLSGGITAWQGIGGAVVTTGP